MYHTMTMYAKVGDDVELDCLSDGNPHPDISWYKYNVPLLEITYRKLEDTFIKSGKLLLSDLLLADAGNYSCHVNNSLGLINRTFILRIYESSNGKPIILKSLLTNNTAVLGGEARFLCQVTSDSVTYVRWHFKRHHAKSNAFDNKTTTIIEITSIAPVKILTSLGPNTLNGDLFKVNAEVFVQNVSFHDEGEYICEAFNQLGSVSWSAFLIAVKGPTPSATDLETRYEALFGRTQEFPLAVIVAIPVAVLVILTALFIRALERAKQRHSERQVKRTDVNRNVSVTSEPWNQKKTAKQKTVKEIIITAPRQTPIYTRKPSEGKTGQQITQLPKDMTSLEACSVRRPVSSQASDVSSERCSDALELEWEGIELVMEEGFEMIKLCKEEEV